MAIQALKIALVQRGIDLAEIELDRDSIKPASTADFGGPPVVFVLRTGTLGLLHEFDDIVVGAGTMAQKGKELSRYLLGRDKIPVLEGNYTSSGRVLQSVNRFLVRAISEGERKIYILSVADAIFDALRVQVRLQNGVVASAIPEGESDSASRLLKLLRKQETPEQKKQVADLRTTFGGDSSEADIVRYLILKAGQTDDPVLLLGETGTGKELVARAIYDLREQVKKAANDHRTGPFMAINCASIPSELLESELFGHKKGSFTHAAADKQGLWQAAAGGTLFLDEIGEMPLEQQTKVLRALQRNEIRQLGSTETIKVNARVIAATNRDLALMIRTKLFREDLYHRLCGLVITTPPLRSQPEQIPFLAQSFWRIITKNPSASLSQDVLKGLSGYSWPGNFRELKRVLRTLKTLFGDTDLCVDHVQGVFQLRNADPPVPDAEPADIEQHLAQCLRWLRRAADVVRTAQVAVAAFRGAKRLNARTAKTVQQSMRASLEQLDVLCSRPLLFHSYGVYDIVLQLREKLSPFVKTQPTEVRQRLSHSDIPAVAEFDEVLSALFLKAESILSGRPGRAERERPSQRTV